MNIAKTRLKAVNPSTEEVLEEYDIMSTDEIIESVKNARKEFTDWKKDIHRRAEFLYVFASEFRKNKENLARTATLEMGKAIKESRSEIEKCAWVAEYYADNGKIFTTEEVVNPDARKIIIRFEPIGVIGSIMPWKFSLLAGS